MTTPRASNLFYLIMGAVSVAIVAGVLAASGVFDRNDAPAASTTPVASTTPASSSSASMPTDVSGIYKAVSPGVVYVASTTSQGQASGSGFVIGSDGSIVTNDHVVENADKFTVRFGEKGDPIPAKLVGKDPSSDLAVLSIDPKKVEGGAKPLSLASSSSLRPGQATIAIGSPFGLSGTVTTGIVSALGREIEAPNGFSIPGAVQTDAAINPGNSGGPLLDADGRVIGVNSQIASQSGSNSGVGFAVPSDTVKDVVPKLIKSGKIDRAWLGLSSAEQPDSPGAVVGTVTNGSPADKAGIRGGDVITAIGGKTIRNPSDLSLTVLTKRPGDEVKVELKRDGKSRTVTVKLGNRPNTPVQ
jgi:putative serine protease PepD